MSEQGEAVKLEARHLNAIEYAERQFEHSEPLRTNLREIPEILRSQQAQIEALTAKLGAGAVLEYPNELVTQVGTFLVFASDQFGAGENFIQRHVQSLREVYAAEIMRIAAAAPQPAEVAGEMRDKIFRQLLEKNQAYMAMHAANPERYGEYFNGFDSGYSCCLNEYAELTRAAAPKAPEAVPLSAAAIFEYIKHGDEDHQRWLMEKLNELFSTAPKAPEAAPLSDEFAVYPFAWMHETSGKMLKDQFMEPVRKNSGKWFPMHVRLNYKPGMNLYLFGITPATTGEDA
jgi:hypothetical protein